MWIIERIILLDTGSHFRIVINVGDLELAISKVEVIRTKTKGEKE